MMRFKHLFSTVIVVLFAVVLAACSHHTPVESKKDSTGYTPDPATEYLVTQYADATGVQGTFYTCLLYTSPSPRDRQKSRMPSSA